MAGRRQRVEFGDRIRNPRAQTGVGTTADIVSDPLTNNPSEMSLVHGDEPVETLSTNGADQSFADALACGVRTGVLSTCRPIEAIARSTVAA